MIATLVFPTMKHEVCGLGRPFYIHANKPHISLQVVATLSVIRGGLALKTFVVIPPDARNRKQVTVCCGVSGLSIT